MSFVPRFVSVLSLVLGLALVVPAAVVGLGASAPASSAAAAGGEDAGLVERLARASAAILPSMPLSGSGGHAHEGDGAGGHEHHQAHSDDAMEGHSHARERTVWPAASGKIPVSGEGLERVTRVLIEGAPTKDQLKTLGIAGSGTLADPYVITGLHVTSGLELKDTDDHYVVRENYVTGTLRLNWNDDRVHVHHNFVRDLRVNENVKRVGEATGGLIERNEFGVVGQIRHFDGVFRDNVVGPAPVGFFDPLIEDTGEIVPVFGTQRIVNIDGFDGAIFERNEIFGYVEMQLHGHHHASCFDCHSHNHGDLKKAAAHDHTVRYHEAVFRDNTVTVERGVAFRYTDAAHSGDDRTAASEPEETLREDHVHFTRILIAGNTLLGGPLVVDIFNADSARHKNEQKGGLVDVAAHEGHAWRGDFVVRDNVVRYTLRDQMLTSDWMGRIIRDGIEVRDAKEARIVLAGNRVELTNAKDGSALSMVPLFGQHFGGWAPAGIHLEGVRFADVAVNDNLVRGPHFGVLARTLAESASWTLAGNSFEDVAKEIDHDASVANAPDGD